MFRCLEEDALADELEVPEEFEELELQAASMSPAVAMAAPRRQCRDSNGMGGTARLLVLLCSGLIRDGPPRVVEGVRRADAGEQDIARAELISDAVEFRLLGRRARVVTGQDHYTYGDTGK